MDFTFKTNFRGKTGMILHHVRKQPMRNSAEFISGTFRVQDKLARAVVLMVPGFLW